MSTPTHDPNGLPPFRAYTEQLGRGTVEHVAGVDVGADGSGTIVTGHRNADGSVTIDTVDELPPDLDVLAAAMHDAGAIAHGIITGNDNAVRWADLTSEHSRDVWRAAAAVAQDLASACCGCNLARQAQQLTAPRSDLCTVCGEYPSHVEHRHAAVRCPRCGGIGTHGTVHRRNPAGGGGSNVPCPNTPTEPVVTMQGYGVVGTATNDNGTLGAMTREKVAARIWRTVFDAPAGAMWSHRGDVPPEIAERCRAAAERLHTDGLLAP